MPSLKVSFELRWFVYDPKRLSSRDILTMRTDGWERIRGILVRNEDGTSKILFKRIRITKR